MAPRKTTKKTTRPGRTPRRAKTTKKKAAKPRISKNQAQGFGSFLKERYSNE